MPYFRKRPVVIEARQVDTSNYDRLCGVMAWCGGRPVDFENDPAVFVIDTLEGAMAAVDRDWIIKGVNGEFYPCKPDIFEATYEQMEF